jgi:hypothetical protein
VNTPINATLCSLTGAYMHILRSGYCLTIKADGFKVISLQICGKFPIICIDPTTFFDSQTSSVYSQSRPDYSDESRLIKLSIACIGLQHFIRPSPWSKKELYIYCKASLSVCVHCGRWNFCLDELYYIEKSEKQCIADTSWNWRRSDAAKMQGWVRGHHIW